MFFKDNRLSVLLTARDRLILTQKTIESINKSTTKFKNIDIYVFDNLSNPSEERMLIFSRLLKDEKIKYYSYDTPSSLTNCFAKAIAFNRWINMMKTSHEIRYLTGSETMNDYFILIDNDFILGPGWDKYFLEAHKKLKDSEPNIHYLVKFPGGIPKIALNESITNKYTFNVDNENFDVIASCWGGGSGFWFFDFNQMLNLEWDYEDIIKTHGIYKKQDSTTWFMIRRRKGENINFVAGIIPPKKDDPLVLHIGESLKCSMCNILTREGIDAYKRNKHILTNKELELKNLSSKEIYDKFKYLESAKIW